MFNELFLTDNYFTNQNMQPCDDGDDTDSPAPTVPDAPILSGQPAAAPDLSAVTGPISGPAAPVAPVAPDVQMQSAPPTAQPVSQIGADVTPPSGSVPITVGGVPQAGRPGVTLGAGGLVRPTLGGTPSVWKNIVAGALMGMASGGRNFGQGMENGSNAVRTAEQQGVENQQKQQQLQFESMQAANEMIRARNEARAADDAHEEHAQTLQNQQIAAQEALEERGITSKVTISGSNPAETHAQASGGLQTLADQNGGTIPRVATTNTPDSASDDGKTHTIHVYNVNAQDIQSNPNGTLDLINDDRRVKGLPPLTQSELQIQAATRPDGKGNWRAGAAGMANDALQNLYTVPTPSKEPAENAATQAHLQQQFDTYKQSPDANPNTVKALQTQLDAFSKAAEGTRAKIAQNESNTTLETAPAKAEAARQEDQAKQTGTTGGQLELQQKRAEIAKTQVETKKAQYDLNKDKTESAQWTDGTTADEKKKAELSENIAFNANEVNNILTRRPDLVGAIAGRFTTTEQMIGNNDPDIQQIGVHIHNIAMANSGVHGFRSQQGVQENEKLMLNDFKNGPDAIKGAMKATTDSVQTFIDDARPNSYGTRTEQGGAPAYYAKQANVARNAAGKVHSNMTDFAHSGNVQGVGTLYTDDNKTYYKADGTIYKGQR